MSSASFRTLYKNLQHELLAISKKTNLLHHAKEVEREKALLTYNKLQLIKSRQPTSKIDEQLKKLESKEAPEASIDSELLRLLVNESLIAEHPHMEKYELQNLDTIATFLRAQRNYSELLERYNPGLSMDQDENVRKTANMVGLLVPE